MSLNTCTGQLLLLLLCGRRTISETIAGLSRSRTERFQCRRRLRRVAMKPQSDSTQHYLVLLQNFKDSSLGALSRSPIPVRLKDSASKR